MREVKSIGDVILEIGTSKEYDESAIAKWLKENAKNDIVH
jgi:hypothetical protein